MASQGRAGRPVSWVVYRAVVRGQAVAPNAVCEQAEWDEMERVQPNGRTLVRGGIASEAVAERLARGTSGDPVPRGARVPAGPRPGGAT